MKPVLIKAALQKPEKSAGKAESDVKGKADVTVNGAIAEGQLAEEALASGATDLVILQPEDEPENVADQLGRLNIIALNFPTFNDGRAYSTASRLRQGYGYEGEIRATGDVRVDQLEQMVRCGFDAFEMAEGQDAQLALQQLDGFSFSYQKAADREPLFRTRSPLAK